MSEHYRSYDMFGFKVTPMTAQEQIDLITSQIEAREHCVISPLNVHGLHVLPREAAMRDLHRSEKTYVVIDGMPIVGLCRLAGIRATRQHRVTNLDLIWPLLALAERKGWRVYFVGNREDVIARGMRAVRSLLPDLQARAHHGFIGIDCPEVVADITNFGADIVMVGMGAGLQERWIHANMQSLPPASFMCVGALMEYFAGTVKTPPRWMGRLGLEWLFRLLDDPTRFWRRYLVEPWGVAWDLAGKVGRSHAGSLE